MDEYTADAFANRDEPLPLLTVSFSDVEGSSSDIEKDGKRQRIKRSLSPSKLKEKVRNLSISHAEKMENNPAGSSIQDRLFARLLQQVVPVQDPDSGGEALVDKRSSTYVQRPAFSLPIMTNNFRRFNARIGIVFVFQNRLIRLFTWRTSTHTVSFLALYTFVCLDPYLLIVLPLTTVLLFIMVPAFITRHPPPPPSSTTSSTTPYSEYTYSGPALAPPRTIRPAAETSKDFFRNMRDLQNSMADFSVLHDSLIALIAPATNFSNEIRSSTLFLYLSILTTAAFISAQLLPWRFIFLALGYAVTISGHPTAQTWLMEMHKKAEKKARDALTPVDDSKVSSQASPSSQPSLFGITPQSLVSTFNSLSAVSLDSAPETREVEIFELQYRALAPATTTVTTPGPLSPSNPPQEWTHHLFTPLPYDPLSPSRIAGDRPKGTRFFEDVQPPPGWAWQGKKWILDLEAGEWVAERLVVGVEYNDVGGGGGDDDDDATAKNDVVGDFGGWVWDLPPAYGGTRDEEVWLAYGDYDLPKTATKEEDAAKAKKKEKEKDKGLKKNVQSRDWEEGVRWEGKGRTGEWRRRRWVRTVKRVGMNGAGSDADEVVKK